MDSYFVTGCRAITHSLPVASMYWVDLYYSMLSSPSLQGDSQPAIPLALIRGMGHLPSCHLVIKPQYVHKGSFMSWPPSQGLLSIMLWPSCLHDLIGQAWAFTESLLTPTHLSLSFSTLSDIPFVFSNFRINVFSSFRIISVSWVILLLSPSWRQQYHYE